MEKKSAIHTTPDVHNIRIIRLMIVTCIFLFAGRSFQHLFQDIPIRILLWDKYLMEMFVTKVIRVSWQDYTETVLWDQRIQNVVRVLGTLYFACLLFCISLWTHNQKKFTWILLAGAVGLLFLSVLYYIDKFNRIGELMEYTCQWMSPVILFLLLQRNMSDWKIEWLMRICVACTFIGHAMYAIGFYPIPGNFIDMIIMSLGVSQTTAVNILWIAGWLDIVGSILILLPYAYRYAALYMFAWGSLTAFARIWANFDPSLSAASLIQWMPEVLVRVPNALLPLGIYLFYPLANSIREIGEPRSRLT